MFNTFQLAQKYNVLFAVSSGMGGKQTVLFLLYLIGGGEKAGSRNYITEHLKDVFGTFYRTKGYGEKQGSSTINQESSNS